MLWHAHTVVLDVRECVNVHRGLDNCISFRIIRPLMLALLMYCTHMNRHYGYPAGAGDKLEGNNPEGIGAKGN
jgi:hypothetical protein